MRSKLLLVTLAALLALSAHAGSLNIDVCAGCVSCCKGVDAQGKSMNATYFYKHLARVNYTTPITYTVRIMAMDTANSTQWFPRSLLTNELDEDYVLQECTNDDSDCTGGSVLYSSPKEAPCVNCCGAEERPAPGGGKGDADTTTPTPLSGERAKRRVDPTQLGQPYGGYGRTLDTRTDEMVAKLRETVGRRAGTVHELSAQDVEEMIRDRWARWYDIPEADVTDDWVSSVTGRVLAP